MAGWKCLRCGTATHRRPPHNLCMGCRSSRRGRNKVKPVARVNQKQTLKPNQQKRENGSKANIEKGQRQAPDGQGRRVKTKSTSQKCQTPAAQCDPYTNFENILEQTYLPQMKSRWRAYLIMGHACRYLTRMRASGQSLPSVSPHALAAFLSVATTVAGLAEEDTIREVIGKEMSGSASYLQFRQAECLLVMTLPGKGDVC